MLPNEIDTYSPILKRDKQLLAHHIILGGWHVGMCQ